MQKAYKYRIYPSKDQEAKLLATLEVCRILYNSCLVDRKNHYEATGKGLSRVRQQEIMAADKKRVLLLNEVHSQVLQDVLFRVDRAFQGFFRRLKENSGKAGYPRFKPEGRYNSITYPQEPGFRIEDGKLHLSKIGHLKIKMHRDIVGKVKTCTIRGDGNQWYACFSAEYEPEIRPVHEKAVGIDVGLKSFAVLSDGTSIENPKHLRKAEGRLRRKQRELSRKIKGGANRKKARSIVTNLHRKVRNQRSDFHHKEVRKIVDSCGLIVVEDLRIRNMVRNRHLSKSISDAGWGGFLNILAYKAEEAGCRFEKVPPHHTSVNCSCCGTAVSKNLATRVHRCPVCGLILDRDHNAAINILQRATAGPAESYAWGEVAQSGASSSQEATSHAAW
jgi:putative transposase